MGFFKLRKPRQFNLKPRYYDEHKERLQQSEERVRKELQMESEKMNKHSFEDAIPGKIRETLEDSRIQKTNKTKVGVMIGVIALAVYLFLNYV